MRRRLSALLLGIVGLGVPFLVAWLARRSEQQAVRGMAETGMQRSGMSPREPLDGSPGGSERPLTRRSPGPGLPILEPHPSGIFAAIGRFDYRFRRLLPILGLAVMIGVNAWARLDGGTLIQGGWVITGSQEQQAAALLASRFGEQATTLIVVYTDPKGNAASDAFQATVKASLADVAMDPSVTGVVTYADTHAQQFLSRNGAETLAVVTLDKAVESAVEDAGRLADKVHPPVGVTTQITGVPQLYHE